MATVRTGENEMGLKKIMDMTRMISVVILLLHIYVVCYGVFHARGWTHPLGDRLLINIGKTGLFDDFNKAKWIALGFLSLSVLGTKGKKGEEFNYRTAIAYLLTGGVLYFISMLSLRLNILNPDVTAGIYIGLTGLGYLLFMAGGSLLTRIIKNKLTGDVFNTLNETFPQEERSLESQYSIHFRTRYKLKNKTRQGYVNIINPFRGTLVMGLTGSGKTRFVVKDMIRQQIEKGYAMFVHDFKYPDLTREVMYHFERNKHRYRNPPTAHVINFEDIQDRCNPLIPQSIRSITDAASASRAILLGLNQDWLEKQGDFWVESSINFVTALIWYLRLYKDGIYCTLPHVIELAQVEFEKLFSILRTEPTLEVLVSPFIKAYEEDAGKQLIGQISGAAISLGTLSTENLYYVLSGDDFTMTINDPEHPKVVCIANNPQVSNIYSAIISLYLNNLQKLLKEQEAQPCSILLEEFANISWAGVDKFLSVCRSYLVSVTLVIQDASQLVLHYGLRQAEVIMSMVGNIISGQVTGDSATILSERFGKILQDKHTLSTNTFDSSFSRSKMLDYAIPVSTIAMLSSGEFVGVVADNPDQRIPQKMFHGIFKSNVQLLEAKYLNETMNNANLLDKQVARQTFMQIKSEIKILVRDELSKIINTPGKLTLTKNVKSNA